MLASRGSTIAHLAVRNGRRLRGRLRLIGIRPDGVASSAVVRAIAAAATGRPCRDERYWLRRIELMRSLLLTSPVPLELVDLGAGAGARLEGRDASGGRVVKKTLGEMTLSSKPQRWAYLLFRIVRELQPEAVLEMGSCVGISAAYQAAALELNGSGRLVTLEGAEQLAETTKRTLNDLNLERRAEVRLGHFSETLDAALTDLKPIGLAFIDGNHVEDATVEYMQLISSVAADEAVLVFDDINWSDGMRRAWSRIVADDRFALTVDLQSVGIAVLSRSSSKSITARIPYY